MNYWPAETTHLAECATALFDFLQGLGANGAKVAAVNYGAHGWCSHHNSDLWRQAAPVGNFGGGSPCWANFPLSGAWLCTHLWEHYSFGGDTEYLAQRAYPILKEAAEFFLAYLCEDPASGWLLSGPSNSPENVYLFQGKPYPVCLMPTADRILIDELLAECIAATSLLGVDDALRVQWEATRARLPPFQIGKHGQIQEWLDDYDEALPHHRHTTQLLGVFPYAQITPDETPALAAAAKVSIARREGAPGGYEEGSWGRNLIMLYHARLGDAAAAHACLTTLWRVEGERSLTVGTKLAPRNAYEMDYNTGATAGIAEMLLQSHRGTLQLLPALPAAWPTGQVSGICARGGFVVDLAWERGELTRAAVRTLRDGVCRVRAGRPVKVHVNGQVVATRVVGGGVVEFAVTVGVEYIVS